MFDYKKQELLDIAEKNNFLLLNVEKVLRLTNILNMINSSKWGKMLVLKGGTAINIFMLDLARLSVDIDLDFTNDCSREQMLTSREELKEYLIAALENEGYKYNDKSRFYHSLDSYIFNYATVSNSIDSLKIDINYSNRIHVLNEIDDNSMVFNNQVSFKRLDDIELVSTKLTALILRTTPRDLFDLYNLFSLKQYDNDLIRKIALFYISLSSDFPVSIEELIEDCIRKINNINYNQLRATLIPVIHTKTKYDFELIKEVVVNFIQNIFKLTDEEKLFIDNFNHKQFCQNLLFEDRVKVELSNHPMVIWKTK